MDILKNKLKRRVVFCFGTRPEAIKMAMVIRFFLSKKDEYEVFTLSTGQHREMLKQVIDLFQIKIDFDLDVMKENQDLTLLTSSILEKTTDVFKQIRPDYVFVQGDTTTAMVCSVAAFYQRIKISHIEAGLRSFDLTSPWPEEGNRKIIGTMANFHFCPTSISFTNLMNENIEKNVFITGNTVVDALFYTVNLIKTNSTLKYELEKRYPRLAEKRIIVTLHRRESHGEKMKNVLRSIKRIAMNSSFSVEVYFPVHLNPNVKGLVYDFLSGIDNIKLLNPLGYLDFTYLLSTSNLAISDSGGVQEEAPTLGVPVLVTRDTTERLEGVQANVVELLGTDEERIYERGMYYLQHEMKDIIKERSIILYGDGSASEKIEKVIFQEGEKKSDKQENTKINKESSLFPRSFSM